MPLARALTITYGSHSFSPSDLIRFYDGWTDGEVVARFVVRAASPALLAAACDTVIQAYRTPHQRTRVTFGGADEIDWNPATASNTALAVTPHIAKVGDVWDSGTAQTFEIHIHAEKPANKDSRAGRQSADVRIEWSESRRRTMTLSGIWTGVANADAAANYTTEVATWSATVRTAVGGTWELEREEYTRDDIDKKLHFVQVWHELIYSQVTSAVVNQHLTISITQERPGDSPRQDGGQVRRVARVEVQYSASVDRSVQSSLPAVYDQLVPWLASRVQDATGASGLGLVSSQRQFDYDDHRISITQTWHAVTISDYLEYLRVERTAYFTGKVLTPVWDGNPWSRYTFVGPASMTLEVTEDALVVGSAELAAFADALIPLTLPPPGAAWEHTHSTSEPHNEIRGDEESNYSVFSIKRTSTFEAAAPVAADEEEKKEKEG